MFDFFFALSHLYFFILVMAEVKQEEDHTFIGDMITAMDKLFDKSTPFATSSQTALGTLDILPIPSCMVLDILTSVDSLPEKTKQMSQLIPQRHVIWVSYKSKAVDMCFEKSGNTYCFDCISVISFPCKEKTPTKTTIVEYDLSHKGSLIKRYNIFRMGCAACAENTK